MIALPFGWVLMRFEEIEELRAARWAPDAPLPDLLERAPVRLVASDRRVLEAMLVGGTCTTRGTIASVAGVTRGSVARVVQRLQERGLIRECQIDRGEGYFLTLAGKAAVNGRA